jgi:hypothetical protein
VIAAATSALPATPVVIVAHRDPEIGERLRDRLERSGLRAQWVGAPSELLAALAPTVDSGSPTGEVAGVLLEQGLVAESVRAALYEAVRCVRTPCKVLRSTGAPAPAAEPAPDQSPKSKPTAIEAVTSIVSSSAS